ncbi:iron-siderophore ABC transporter substrate-binding protein [Terrihabitans soli]|nr:iron-siderophore ABC transporter substrate-binding protein [Terrihabitans soli]
MKQIALAVLAFLLAAPAVSACEGRLVDSKFVLHTPLCVPKEPKRIAVIDPTFSLGMSLELGLPVVAAPLFKMSDPVLKARAQEKSIIDLGSYLEPSIEMLIGAKPDLIIGSGLADAYYPMLSQIAPTLLYNARDWRDIFSTIADATGQGARKTDFFAPYDARVASIRARMPNTRVSVLRITSWDFQVYTDGPDAYAPFEVLQDAGVRRSAYETVTDDTGLKRPDWEALSNLDGDVLLYIIGGGNNSDTSGRHEEVTGNPLWKMLPAVKAGRVYRVDAGTWMEFSGLASANRVLDDIERYILKTQ